MSQRKIFSDGEKVCLQELIIKYKLNSPSTISAGNQNVKKRAWSRLVEDYNSIGGNSKRTEAQLKKCWDNLKSRKKNFLAIQKRERMKTGGGPFQPRPGPSHEDPALLDADQTRRLRDAEMKFVVDSDSSLESQEANVTPSQIYLHLDDTEERDIPRNQAPQSPATQDTEPEIEIQRESTRKRKYIPETEDYDNDEQCENEEETMNYIFVQNSQSYSDVGTFKPHKKFKDSGTCTSTEIADQKIDQVPSIFDLHGCKHFGQFVSNELLRFDTDQRYIVMQKILEVLKRSDKKLK